MRYILDPVVDGLDANMYLQGPNRQAHDLGLLLPRKRFVLMHEPVCIDELTTSKQADVIIYGHTHETDIRKGDTLIINPGEGGQWVTGRSTIVLLDLITMEAEIEEIG